MEEIIKVVRGCNTFTFFVEPKTDHKLVTVKQHTDFAGTELETDFPEGDNSTWESKVLASLTDEAAVNLIGGRLLEVWHDI